MNILYQANFKDVLKEQKLNIAPISLSGGGELKCDKSLALGLYTKHLFMQRRANISDHKNANRDRSTKL